MCGDAGEHHGVRHLAALGRDAQVFCLQAREGLPELVVRWKYLIPLGMAAILVNAVLGML